MLLVFSIDKEDDEAMDSATPSPKSLSPTGAEGGDDDDEDEEDGAASKPINEDWDSGKIQLLLFVIDCMND